MKKVINIFVIFFCLLALFVGLFGSSIIGIFTLIFVIVFLLFSDFIRLCKWLISQLTDLRQLCINLMHVIRDNGITILLVILFVSLLANVMFCIAYFKSKFDLNSIELVINVIGAFLALVLTYALLKPNFELSQIIARSLNNRIWILVQNNSLIAKLYSLHVELFYCGKYSKVNDEALSEITLDSNSIVTLLSNRLGSNMGQQYNRFFVFHSTNCYYKWLNQVKCRISATNTISNIVDIKDFYISADDVRWGEYIGNKFYSVLDLYQDTEQERVKKLIAFNETICKVLRPRKKLSKNDHEIFCNANKLLADSFKEYCDVFTCLNSCSKIVDDMAMHIFKLYKLLQEDIILRPVKKAYRDSLLIKINQELYCISSEMEKSLARKIN